MPTYAQSTSVSVGRTKGEIEDLLHRYKADKIFSGQESGRAVVGFEMKDRRVQFELALPDVTTFAKRMDGRSGTYRTVASDKQLLAWEQACRTRWRALFLAIKAKLVSTETGVETFEEAFLAQIVIPGRRGETVGSWAIGALAEAYSGTPMPPLLPAARGKS